MPDLSQSVSRIHRTNIIKVIDLFCGCGGMSLGFQNAGFEIVAAFDFWEPAVNVYRNNFDHPVYSIDLSSSDANGLISSYKPEIIIGGPPCQDFSDAGPRDETQGRASLTRSFAEIILFASPKMFVMENVPRVRNTKIYKSICSLFRNAGYGLSEHLLNASYCGVPQSRRRFFLIGELNNYDQFLSAFIDEKLSSRAMTIHDYLGDSLGVEYYFRIPRSYSRRAIFSIHEPSMTIRGVDRPIPKTYRRHPSDPVEIGPEVRSLTVLERSFIQTFPPTFNFDGTKSDLNQMIGNAVPVKMAEFIAMAIKTHISGKHKDQLF